jgi:hypothetical protein
MLSSTEKKLHLEVAYLKRKAEKERKGQKVHGLITEVAQEYIGRGFDFVSRKKLYYHVKKLMGNGSSSKLEAEPHVPGDITYTDGGQASKPAGCVNEKPKGSTLMPGPKLSGRPSTQSIKQKEAYMKKVEQAMRRAVELYSSAQSSKGTN